MTDTTDATDLIARLNGEATQCASEGLEEVAVLLHEAAQALAASHADAAAPAPAVQAVAPMDNGRRVEVEACARGIQLAAAEGRAGTITFAERDKRVAEFVQIILGAAPVAQPLTSLTDRQISATYIAWDATAGASLADLMRAAVAEFCRINGLTLASTAAGQGQEGAKA